MCLKRQVVVAPKISKNTSEGASPALTTNRRAVYWRMRTFSGTQSPDARTEVSDGAVLPPGGWTGISSRLDCEERLQRVGRAVVRLVRRPVIASFKSFRDVVLWRQNPHRIEDCFRHRIQYSVCCCDCPGWMDPIRHTLLCSASDRSSRPLEPRLEACTWLIPGETPRFSVSFVLAN